MALLEKLNFVTKSETEFDTESEPEFETLLSQDPEPAEAPAPRRTRTNARRSAPRAAPAQPSIGKLRKEVTDDATTILEMVAAVWEFSGDSCCAPILNQQAKPLATSLVAIVARNPKLLAALAHSDSAVLLVQILSLGKAVQPLANAMWKNHVSADHDHEGGADDGRVHLGDFPAFTGIPRTVPA